MNSQTMLLSELFAVFNKNKLLILLSILLTGGAAYYVSQNVIVPTYEASTQVLIVQKDKSGGAVDVTEVSSSLSLINTYRVIMRSPAILNVVKDQVANAPDDISDVLIVESEEESQVINIIVDYQDPVIAAEIANVITNVFASEIPELMNIDNVRVLSLAEVPENPVAPNVMMNTAFGLFLGLVVGGVLALIRNTFDKRIRDEAEAEKLLSVSVIGAIPLVEKRDLVVKKPKTESLTPPLKGEDVHVSSAKSRRQSS